MIVSPEGYVLTNNHVVDHATEITVTLRDKREMKAEVVGTDPRTDIALLKIEGSNFPYVTLGDSSKVQVGDVATLIGADGEDRITAEEVAQWSGTISYEVLTSLGPRVERRYSE